MLPAAAAASCATAATDCAEVTPHVSTAPTAGPFPYTVDNVKALNCYYARSAVDDLKRRSYWRLEAPPGRPLIVLVHYLHAEGKMGSGQQRGYACGPRDYQYDGYDSEGDAAPPARRARSWQHAPRGPPLPWPPQLHGFLVPPAHQAQQHHYQQQQQQQAAVAAFAAAAAALMPGAAPQVPLYQQPLPHQQNLDRLTQWLALQQAQNGGLPPAGFGIGAASLSSLGGSGIWDSGGLPLLPGAPAAPPAGSSSVLEGTGMLATPSHLSHLQQLTSLSLLSQMSSQQLGQMQAAAPVQQQQQPLSQSPGQNGQLAASLSALLSQSSSQTPGPAAPAPVALVQLPPSSSPGYASAYSGPTQSSSGPATAGPMESLTQIAVQRPEQLRALLSQLVTAQPTPLQVSEPPTLPLSPSAAPAPVLQSQPAAGVALPPPEVPAAATASEQQQQEALLPPQRQQGTEAPSPAQAPEQVQTVRSEAAGSEPAALQSQRQLAAAVRQLCALAGKEQLANELLAGLAAATGSGVGVAAAGGSADGTAQPPPEPLLQQQRQQEDEQSLPEQRKQQHQLSQEALEPQDNAPLAPATQRQEEQLVMVASLPQSLSSSLPLEQQQEPDWLAGDR